MTSLLKALVVDFGGVLTTPLQDAMAEFARELNIDFEDLVRAALGAYTGERDDLVTNFETGKISEDEFASAFAERLSTYAGKPVSPRNLVPRMFQVRLEDDMLAAVEAAHRAGYKTGLLSNSWGAHLYPRERLEPLFDAIVISGEVGLRKPDSRIFELVAERLGVNLDECLFVDDHPDHLKAAAEQGMLTILHQEPARTIAEMEERLSLVLS